MQEKVFLRLLLILLNGSIKNGLEIGRRGRCLRHCDNSEERRLRPGYDTSTAAGKKRPSGNTRSRIVRHEVCLVTPALPRRRQSDMI
ncbi:hypothetical protein EDB85DRAFT_1994626, partial [Lactarius pseudohatsudake]